MCRIYYDSNWTRSSFSMDSTVHTVALIGLAPSWTALSLWKWRETEGHFGQRQSFRILLPGTDWGTPAVWLQADFSPDIIFWHFMSPSFHFLTLLSSNYLNNGVESCIRPQRWSSRTLYAPFIYFMSSFQILWKMMFLLFDLLLVRNGKGRWCQPQDIIHGKFSSLS